MNGLQGVFDRSHTKPVDIGVTLLKLFENGDDAALGLSHGRTELLGDNYTSQSNTSAYDCEYDLTDFGTSCHSGFLCPNFLIATTTTVGTDR